MALSEQQFNELRAQGLTFDQIKKFESGWRPSAGDTTGMPGPGELKPPGQVFGPKAAQRRWLKSIPYVLGAVGSGGPPIQVGPVKIPRLLGLPGAYAGGFAGLPIERALAQEPMPSLQEMNQSGLRQAALQAPGAALELGAGQLVRLGGWARQRAIQQAQKEAAAPVTAAREELASQVSQRVPAARQARASASRELDVEISKYSKDKITFKELLDEIVSRREAAASAAGIRYTPEQRQLVENDIRKRLLLVVPKQTGRLVSGRKLEWNMPTAQFIKRRFDKMLRTVQAGKETGVQPKPDDDLDILESFRSIIERRVPRASALNQATQRAMRTEGRLLKKQKALPVPEQLAIEDAVRNRRVAAHVIATRSANPFVIYKGLPVRGGVAMPGLSIRPGHLAEAGMWLGNTYNAAPRFLPNTPFGPIRPAPLMVGGAIRAGALMDELRRQGVIPDTTATQE